MLFCNATESDANRTAVCFKFGVDTTYMYNAKLKRVVMQVRMQQVSGCRKLLRNKINNFAVGINIKLSMNKPIPAVMPSYRCTDVM
jgi:hypothetical protein